MAELWTERGLGTPSRSYAAERWAEAVTKVVTAREDLRTLALWGRHVGVSVGALSTWCRAAQVSPRRSLELGRLARAIVVTGGALSSIQDVLDIVEPRTVQRLFERAGLPSPRNSSVGQLTLADLLARQRFVSREPALRALRRRLLDDIFRDGPPPSTPQ